MAENFILKIGSTYAGAIDAFSYAATELNKIGGGNFEICWQLELERKAHVYLNKNYPGVKRYFFDEWHEQYKLEYVNILCGGDPCQPNSIAGERLGQDDDRFRWPHLFSLAKALRPDWIINENVIGSISNMVLDQKITDLESIGYTCQAYNIPATGVNAHHERKRIFLVANSNVWGRQQLLCTDYGAIFETCTPAITLGAQGNAFLQFEKSMAEPALFSLPDGLPDNIFRLGAAGNSIVSAIPIIFLTAIYNIEKMIR